MPQFVLDVHLAKLARHLRMVGLDSLWRPDYSDPQLLEISATEKRVLLTKDRALFESTPPSLRYYVTANDPKVQLTEVLQNFECLEKAKSGADFLTICLECNAKILKVGRAQIVDRVPANSLEHFQEFFLCPRCERVYWKGSHYDRMKNWVAEL